MSDTRGRFKNAVSRNEMSSSSSSTSSFSSDDESDSDGDLKPIKDYMSNRKEVARQLFKSVKIEKIRMMLPQVLKKMELSELEEWCASELAGMSKTRILSILNGTPMSGSSATSDSDDSGPSLEIISDTEEWLTDDETNVKQEPLSPSSKTKKIKAKRKAKPGKNEAEKAKGRKGKSRPNQDTDNVKVKKEKDKNDGKNQEGESLLDLLELEMRARAIRALIRKEEDIIPTSESEQKKNSNINALKSTLSSAKSAKNKTNSENSQTAMETSETLVEKIGEDEDVVLLIKPTPTIEVISSDSETENGNGRVNKRLENERTPEKSKDAKRTSNERTPEKSKETKRTSNERTPEKSKEIKRTSNERTPEKSKEIKRTSNERTPEKRKEIKITSNERIVTAEGNGSEILRVVVTNDSLSGEIINTKLQENIANEVNDKLTSEVSSKESTDNVKQTKEITFRKLKRRANLRTKSKSLSECTGTTNIISEVVNEDIKQSQTTEEGEVNEENKLEVSKVDKETVTKKIITLNEDKFGDYEEIIDLDDYPDDMYVMEADDSTSVTESKSTDEIEASKSTDKVDADENVKETDNSAETWATRYYQTDNVQNVIKESKIQSEIRKRLRERQRLSKLNNSPKESPKPNEDTNDIKFKPTGSVDEYLILKGAATITETTSVESSENQSNQINEEALPAPEKEATVSIQTNESSTVSEINKS